MFVGAINAQQSYLLNGQPFTGGEASGTTAPTERFLTFG